LSFDRASFLRGAGGRVDTAGMAPPPAPDARGTRTAPTTNASAAHSKGWLLVTRVKAVMLLFTCFLAMAASLFLHPLLSNIVSNQGVKVGEFGALYLRAPWIGVLLALPAVATCIPLIRGTGRPMLWMTIATLALLLPVAFLFGAFLAAVGPLYASPDL